MAWSLVRPSGFALALCALVVVVGGAGGCASSSSEPEKCDAPGMRITVTYPASQDFCDVTQGSLRVDFGAGDALVTIDHWNQRFFAVEWPNGVQRGDEGEITFEATGPSERGVGQTTVTANPGDCADVIIEAVCGPAMPADAGLPPVDAGLPDATM